VDYVSETVIKVENLGKKYVLSHQQEGQNYKALRDVLADGAKSLGKKFLKPYGTKVDDPTHEEFWALRDISFEVNQGDRVGIIGRNGAGKSTLLKILSRITEPTLGSIKIKGRIASLLEVGTGFHPELTGRENIFLNGAILGMSKVEIQRKFDEIVEFAEVEKFLDTPVKRYSSGMYVRLAFAVAAHLEPEVLIVDEVLAVGDTNFQNKCIGKMEDISHQGRTIIFVSHNMAMLRQLCSHGIYLNSGNLAYRGNIEDSILKYEDLFNRALNTKRGKVLEKGILYKHENILNHQNYWVERIEIRDKKLNLTDKISTWDNITIRIYYLSKKKISNGSVVLTIQTSENFKLLRCSTMPDQKIPLQILEGKNYIDCTFESWPFAAGKYFLHVAFAIPMVEWLFETKEPIPLITNEKDIFNSGFPPNSSSYAIATPYTFTYSQ
jgi:lipopolysaccharide transport system ATP-binding protein